MEEPVWFAGVCDVLLSKIATWNANYYTTGDAHSTRDFLNEEMRIVPVITKRVHTIAFSEPETVYLRKIMKKYCSNKPLVEEVNSFTSNWKAKPLALNKTRKFRLALYPEHVQQILDALIKAKREHLNVTSVDKMIEESKNTGKDLFGL
jgi:hypothetical protein